MEMKNMAIYRKNLYQDGLFKILKRKYYNNEPKKVYST